MTVDIGMSCMSGSGNQLTREEAVELAGSWECSTIAQYVCGDRTVEQLTPTGGYENREQYKNRRSDRQG
jgi:hypothetical protein